jgi:signal transduction histidine kinase
MKRSFRYILYALFLIIFIAIIALGVIARENGSAFVKTSAQIEVTNNILAQTGLIDALDDEKETEVRNYLATNDEALLNHSEESEQAMLFHFKKFKALVGNNPLQRIKADSLESNMGKKTLIFDSAIALQKAGQNKAALVLVGDEKNQQIIEETGKMITRIETSEREYLSRQKELGDKTIGGLNGIFWIILLIPVVLLAGSLYAVEYVFAVRKKSEDAIQKLNETLKEANKDLESFSYSVSHDLRAPLRIVSECARLLSVKERENLPAKCKALLEEIMNNSVRMENLIDDLLNFSKMGRAALEKREVDMNTGVRVVVEELQKSLNGSFKSNIVVHDLKPAACDPNLMKQVWANLISNAVKYSHKKETPQVEIGSEESGGTTIYYVKDNGAGFDMAAASKLFGVFQRLHKSSEYEGTGVGLALVHKIISKHGGRIWAEGKVDNGAVFYFTLS